jgi:hypothetical protein
MGNTETKSDILGSYTKYFDKVLVWSDKNRGNGR